jgi:ribosomal protein S24E
MKMKILEEKHNPFLKRKELLVHIDHDGEATPSMRALEHFLAKTLNVDSEKMEILNIYSARGAAIAKSQVRIWNEMKPKKERRKEKSEEANKDIKEEKMIKEWKPKEDNKKE